MNDLDEIRKRMSKRKGVKTRLNDNHFKKIYNAMIKMMVAMIVVVSMFAYVKVSPNGEYIKEYIFNDLNFYQVATWVKGYLGMEDKSDQVINMTDSVSYTQIKDNYYKNQTNEVLNFDKGRVVYIGKQDILGQYVTVLLDNNIEVTYGQLDDVFVGLYDYVDHATILGTYNKQVMLIFTQGEKEIDYATFEDYLS